MADATASRSRRGIKVRRRPNCKTIRARRSRLLLYNGPFCHLCGKLILRSEISLEHVVPLHWGGTNAIDNLALAHKLCNWLKGSDIEEHRVAKTDDGPSGCSHGCCATPREHWLSVAISPTATPTRRENATRPKEG